MGLERVRAVWEKMGEPHAQINITVGGTNGKGSTCAMLESILCIAGFKTGFYTSPHLVRFNERIAVPGPDGRSRPIPEDALVRLLERIEAVNDGERMTFFEITTAAALLAFAETPADAVLLEVGLGGRLDATNVIERPRLTVITPVSIDHADKLGDTVARIAAEKAGILKRGVTGVIARQDDAAMAVIKAAAARVRAPLQVWGEDYDAYEQRGRLVFQAAERLLDLPRPALIGTHQIVNAGTAVAAALALGDLVDEKAIERGLVAVTWPARMQRLNAGPLLAELQPGSELWLDGGHNPAGAAALADTLAAIEERAPKPLVLVAGLMGQKDANGFLGPFRGLARMIVTVPIPGAHMAPLAPDAFAARAKALGFEAEPAAGVIEALRRIEAAPGAKRIVICGSLYLAGHVLALQEGVAAQTN